MSKDLISDAYESVIEYARNNFAREIDEAYDFFWEEEDPAEIMGGHALELSFINFEDWLVCDYIPGDSSPGLVDRFIEAESPEEWLKDTLLKLKKSHLSLYEVISAGDPAGVSDIATGNDEFKVSDEQIAALEKGYTFAARFVEIGGVKFMGRSVYPFGVKMKDEIKWLINAQFDRYRKNKNPEGRMDDFLRDESYALNMTWVSCLHRPAK